MKISTIFHMTRRGGLKRNPQKIASEYLTIHRVPSGDEETGENRQYWVGGNPPIANIEDWKIYAKKQKYSGLRIFELDGKVKYWFA